MSIFSFGLKVESKRLRKIFSLPGKQWSSPGLPSEARPKLPVFPYKQRQWLLWPRKLQIIVLFDDRVR